MFNVAGVVHIPGTAVDIPILIVMVCVIMENARKFTMEVNMNKKILLTISILTILSFSTLAACGVAANNTSTESSAQATTLATEAIGLTTSEPTQELAAPPGGMPPGDNQPGGGTGTSDAGSALSTATGVYTLDGGTDDLSGQSYTASNDDQSAIYVTNGGTLTLDNATITTTGNTSSNDYSSFYGLNAAVLATSGSTVNISDSSINTTGSGANGAFATGTGSSVVLQNVTIDASGGGGHGVMATQGGTVSLTDVDITTSGANSAPIATDRGGGTITSLGGTVSTSGQDSPCLYSTGVLTSTDLTCTSTSSESAVIEGANSISVQNSSLISSMEDKWGVLIYQSMSGDAEGTEGTFSMTGGILANDATTGPLFFITNSTAYITLNSVEISAGSGVLLQAAGTDRWGTSGSNGGSAYLTANGQNLAGDFLVDDISTLSLTLQNSSSLTGAINANNTGQTVILNLDATSTWTVSADSYLTCLTESAGISGSTVSNIIGNGHTVYYQASACSELGGQTYTLSGGGYLMPSN